MSFLGYKKKAFMGPTSCNEDTVLGMCDGAPNEHKVYFRGLGSMLTQPSYRSLAAL